MHRRKSPRIYHNIAIDVLARVERREIVVVPCPQRIRAELPLVPAPAHAHRLGQASPPPWGWSTGFIDTPRLEGLMPFQRLRPALPMLTFSWSVLPTWPMVAMHSTSTLRVSPEGSFSSA